MLDYLKAAFWVRSRVPGLGNIPWNVLILVGFVILGIGHPGFWLLGAGLEAAFLTLLSTNSRFQNLVDARSKLRLESNQEEKRKELVERLDRASQQRMSMLRKRCRKVLQIYAENQTEDFIVEGNSQALQRLEWLYLKLLTARHMLLTHSEPGEEARLRETARALASDLEKSDLSETLRQSKAATLKITRQRLAHLDRREETLAEIDSDLTRIEAQIDLALDQATMSGKPEVLSGNVDLASTLLDDALYGDSSAEVASLDASFDYTSPASKQTQ